MSELTNEWLDDEDMAEQVFDNRISPRTPARWRRNGTGPAWHKLGHRVLYRRSDVLEWLAQNRRGGTKEVVTETESF